MGYYLWYKIRKVRFYACTLIRGFGRSMCMKSKQTRMRSKPGMNPSMLKPIRKPEKSMHLYLRLVHPTLSIQPVQRPPASPSNPLHWTRAKIPRECTTSHDENKIRIPHSLASNPVLSNLQMVNYLRPFRKRNKLSPFKRPGSSPPLSGPLDP